MKALHLFPWLWGFPHSSVGKESACNAGDPCSIPGLGRSAGKGIDYPLQYSWASLVTQLVKWIYLQCRDLGSIPGLGWSPGEGKGYPLQYSGLENVKEYSPWGPKESCMTEWLSLSLSMALNTIPLLPLSRSCHGTSLEVQWLRSCTSNTGDPGSASGQGTRSHLPQLRSEISIAATKTQFS